MMFVFCKNNPMAFESFSSPTNSALSIFDTPHKLDNPMPTKPAT